jgi:recombination protein RecA
MPVKKNLPIKGKASDAVLAALQKEFGDGIGQRGGNWPDAERIPVDIFPFDYATGGGIPRGRCTMFYGKEGSTKSLTLYRALAQVQKTGETGVLIDAEHVYDTSWAKRTGVNTAKLIVIQPDNGEQAVDAAEAMMYASDVGMVGIDSVAAIVPNNEIESSASKQQVAGNALLLTKFTRKMVSALTREAKNSHRPALVLVNQIRYKLGVMYGDPENMPGGEALKFMTSLRVRFYGTDKKIEGKADAAAMFKEVSAQIKKHRVPIIGKNFTYDISVNEQSGMDVGQVEVWPTVFSVIKDLGLLQTLKNGYEFMNETYKTQGEIKQKYNEDAEFKVEVNNLLWTLGKQQIQK